MDFPHLKRLLLAAEQLSRLCPEPYDRAFWQGYKRGLGRYYYGQTFGTDTEHAHWMRLADETVDWRRRHRGLGYRAGLNGLEPADAITVLTSTEPQGPPAPKRKKGKRRKIISGYTLPADGFIFRTEVGQGGVWEVRISSKGNLVLKGRWGWEIVARAGQPRPQIFPTEEEAQRAYNQVVAACQHEWLWLSDEEQECEHCGTVTPLSLDARLCLELLE